MPGSGTKVSIPVYIVSFDYIVFQHKSRPISGHPSLRRYVVTWSKVPRHPTSPEIYTVSKFKVCIILSCTFYRLYRCLGLNGTDISIKVGRTNDMARRWGEHRRHCPLLKPTLLGYFPPNGETSNDLAAGRVNPGGKTTPSSHLLERVVHQELTEVAVHAPYLSPNGTSGGLNLGATQVHRTCPSCKYFPVTFSVS